MKSRDRCENLFSESLRIFLCVWFMTGRFWGHSARRENPVAITVNSPAWVRPGYPSIPTIAPRWQASFIDEKSSTFDASSIIWRVSPLLSRSRKIKLPEAFLFPMILPPVFILLKASGRSSRPPWSAYTWDRGVVVLKYGVIGNFDKLVEKFL